MVTLLSDKIQNILEGELFGTDISPGAAFAVKKKNRMHQSASHYLDIATKAQRAIANMTNVRGTKVLAAFAVKKKIGCISRQVITLTLQQKLRELLGI